MKKTKIVFKDGSRNKAVVGVASLQQDFVKICCDDGNVLYINKRHIVFMKEADF